MKKMNQKLYIKYVLELASQEYSGDLTATMEALG